MSSSYQWGVKIDAIRQRLLAETKLTHKRAIELSQGLETAAQNVQTLKNPSRELAPEPTGTAVKQEVHKVAPPAAAREVTCYRCGKTRHIAPKCLFMDNICNQCGKKGHLKVVCRSNPREDRH